jgi:hypothetical protein
MPYLLPAGPITLANYCERISIIPHLTHLTHQYSYRALSAFTPYYCTLGSCATGICLSSCKETSSEPISPFPPPQISTALIPRIQCLGLRSHQFFGIKKNTGKATSAKSALLFIHSRLLLFVGMRSTLCLPVPETSFRSGKSHICYKLVVQASW